MAGRLEFTASSLALHFTFSEVDSSVVGEGQIHRWDDEDGTAWFWGIEVYPFYRGLGYGKQLVTAMLNRARDLGFKRVLLWVKPENKTAIQLYLSLGFSEDRESERGLLMGMLL